MATDTRSVPAAYRLDQIAEILLPRPHYASVLGHVVRKLTGHYLDGESAEAKAFGILAGRLHGTTVEVTAVFPLLVNLRQDTRYAADMDEVVNAHAIPSQTPNEHRGWIAHPRELLAIESACDDHGWVMFGHYHTHRVAWPHDLRRDTCTQLDQMLATGTGQWAFIVSAVDLHQLSLRAFYEGDNQREATVHVLPELRKGSL
jgi:JAB1/Mov34/MPN/PAD-1 ubiquitin protease